jgi:2-polyprenyl-3-methyl-5-hydroxy-6-metoxy-1,4-benzoquinol methylase
MSQFGREFWDESYRDYPAHTMVPDILIEEEIRDLPPGRALDMGCGSGENALKLARLGWSVTGLDWSGKAIELALRSAADGNFDVAFLVADAAAWRSHARFDLVVSTYALPGGEDSRRVLKTASRVLAPGGTLIIAEWDESMGEVWAFMKEELLSPGKIALMLADLEVEKSEVRRFDNFFSPDDPRAFAGTAAAVAFVRARKPSL